jgi:hypothetical protein
MADLRTIVDANQDIFRYGLHKYRDSAFEDPTYLGFTIELDDNSALFTQVLPFLEKRGNQNWTELQSRIPVYKQFVSKIQQIFNSQESVVTEFDKTRFIKQHYINSVTGLNNLTKKFNLYQEDKLDFQLHEDIAMWSTYLSYLYNNLTYSYENGRELIPENLLKFNMYIKISEIRSLTSIGKLKSNDASDLQIADALKNNVTQLVYKLYDCQFNFIGATPVDDTINQAGIDTPTFAPSIVPFSVFFKSVSRQIYNPLITNSLAMNDNKIDLDVILVNPSGDANPGGQTTDNKLGPDGKPFQKQQVDSVSKFKQEAFKTVKSSKKPSAPSTVDNEEDAYRSRNDISGLHRKRNELIEENEPLKAYQRPGQPDERPQGAPDDLIAENKRPSFLDDPQQALDNFGEKLGKRIENTLNLQKDRAINRIKQKRNELVKTFIYDIQNRIGIKTIVPANVYVNNKYLPHKDKDGNIIGGTILDQLASDVGVSTSSALINIITGN